MTVVALAVLLTVPGLLLARVITRSWPFAVPLAPLVTALACAVGAIIEVATGVGLLVCVVPVIVVMNGLTLWSCRKRYPVSSDLSLLSTLAICAAAALMLIPLIRPAVDWDTRATWFRLARWLTEGGRFTQHAIGNDAYPFNRDYPPFAAATIAVFWRLGAGIDDRSGQLIVGLLNGSAAVVTALAFPRLFRRARLGPMPAVLGMAFVIAAFGISKQYGTDGYQDLLWGLTAVGATVYLLIAPVGSTNGAVGVVLVLASVLTKNDATVTAIVIALLAAYRYRVVLRRNPAPLLLSPLLVVWSVLARHFGSVSQFEIESIVDFLTGDTQLWKRFDPTVTGIEPYLALPVALVLGVAVLGTLTVVSARRRLGLGSSWRLWLVWLSMCGSLVLAYVIANSTLSVHLQSSVDRTTSAPHVLLLAELALWTLTAMSFLVMRSGAICSQPGSTRAQPPGPSQRAQSVGYGATPETPFRRGRPART